MRQFIFLIITFCLAVKGNATDPRPNIILIITDDQGYNDLSCYSQRRPLLTPKIDALAASGIRFTNGYATHHGCAPSRAALLAGRYQQRIGFYDIWEVQKGMPQSEKLLPQYLHDAGYVTGLIGKWHLGEKQYNHPLKKGYDKFFGFLGGMHDYYKPMIGDSWAGGGNGTAPIYNQYDTVGEIKYLTDELTNRAIDFMSDAKGKPFFLHLAYNAPHGPFQSPGKYIDQEKTTENYRKIKGMTRSLDENIGRLLQFLDEKKQRSNTLIIYLSDNGGTRAHDNGALRGAKGNLFEGGIRVPFIVSYPAKFPAGKTYDEPVIALDIFPTILSVAGIASPNDKTLDGINLSPFLTGAVAYNPHEQLFWSWDPYFDCWAVRSGEWKAVREKVDGKIISALYNLHEDISEKNNLIDQQGGKFKELEHMYRRWISAMPPSLVGDHEWTPNGDGWKYKYEKTGEKKKEK